jgi:hypothetical protein
MRERLRPPVISVAPDEVEPMLRRGALAPYWGPEVARALLPIFGVGDDGQARARLPHAQHMAILDGMFGDDLELTLKSVRCPAWLVSCEPPGSFGDETDAWSGSKAAGLAVAARTLPDARLMRWSGALHDVPLQWPALVSGLVRAACGAAARPDPDAREEAR